MEAVDILWHVLATLAFVGVVLHLNRRLAEFAERDRLLWTMLLCAPLNNGQSLPAAKMQSICLRVLRMCEKELKKRFSIQTLSLSRPGALESIDAGQFVRPLWALMVSPLRELDHLENSTTSVFLNRQPASLFAVATALNHARLVNLSWQEGQWHFEIS